MKNTLQSRNFRFEITEDGNNKSVADFIWQIADVTIPTITLNETSISVPGVSNLRSAGTGVTLGDVDIEFVMDAEYTAYTNLYKWILSANAGLYGSNVASSFKKDAILMVLDSTQQSIVTVYRFYDMFPINLDALSFTYGESGAIDAVSCNATFAFSTLELLDKNLNPVEIG